jgi:hypothetical protein
MRKGILVLLDAFDGLQSWGGPGNSHPVGGSTRTHFLIISFFLIHFHALSNTELHVTCTPFTIPSTTAFIIPLRKVRLSA